MCLARLAGATAQDRDFDRTADAARESLRLIEGGQSSSRTREQLVAVREQLHAHRASPAVRDTFDLLTDHIA